jgi:hypothetical protein
MFAYENDSLNQTTAVTIQTHENRSNLGACNLCLEPAGHSAFRCSPSYTRSLATSCRSNTQIPVATAGKNSQKLPFSKHFKALQRKIPYESHRPETPLLSAAGNLVQPTLPRRSAFDEGGSKPVQPNPTKSNHPPPPGKETGKEMVKFLATFDHMRSRAPRLNASSNSTVQRFTLHPIQRLPIAVCERQPGFV